MVVKLRDNGVERTPYDFSPDIHQLIELLGRKEFYKLDEFKPLWSAAVIAASEIHNKLRGRRADHTQFIWERYEKLERMFLDIVRDLQAHGQEQRLAQLKPVIKRAFGIDARWLVFHCPKEDGGVVHVMV